MRTAGCQVTRVGKRNQVTIPAAMLRRLGVGPGDTVELEVVDGEVQLRKAKDPIDHAFGLLWRPDLPQLEIEELERLIHDSRDIGSTEQYLETFAD